MKEKTFLDFGYTQFCDDSTIALCKELLHLVDSLPESSWTQVIRANGITADYSLFPHDKRIDKTHKIAQEEAASGLFSYSFARIADMEDNARLLQWRQLKELLLSSPIAQIIAAHTGQSISQIDLVYANCFRDGDFLTTHTDKGGGTHSKIAAAFSLTESWDPTEGGCTYILKQDRKSVIDVVSPNLGCILLLDLSNKEVPHYVSEVKKKRLGDSFLRKSMIVRYS